MGEIDVIDEGEDGTFAILDAKSSEVVERGMTLKHTPSHRMVSLVPLPQF
jgi:hypothetical protein